MSKNYKAVKREEDNIFIETDSRKNTFFKKYGRLTIFISIIVLLSSLVFTLTNLDKVEEYTLNNTNINIIFPDEEDDDGKIVIGNNESVNDEKKEIVNKKTEELFVDILGIPDEVIFKIKTIILSDMTLVYYSDNSVKVINKEGTIKRILPIANNYSVTENGSIDSQAKMVPLTIVKKEKSSLGTIVYYSDNSAEVIENKVDIWVGSKNKIEDYYITSNKLTYSKEEHEYNGYKTTTYQDGTIVVSNNNEKFILRDKADVNLTENNYEFINNNAASIISTKKLDNGFTIEYISDGGALIYSNEGNISVRKSNSIVIEDNKLIRVKLTNEVEVSSSKEIDNKKIFFYNNGSAIVKENTVEQKIVGYVPENEKIKINNNTILEEDKTIIPVNNIQKLKDDVTIVVFEDGVALVDDQKTYIDKDDTILLDQSLNVKFAIQDAVNADITEINISNKSKKNIAYKVVLEQSNSTTLQDKYIENIKYTLPSNEINSINKKLFDQTDAKDYILYEGIIEANSSNNLLFAVWLDYTSLNNDAQGKYFYGTIKVYSYQEN